MKRRYPDRYAWVDEVVRKATKSTLPAKATSAGLSKKERKRLKQRKRKFGNKTKDKFLLSYEWAVVRQEALRLNKDRWGIGRCEACGRGTADGVNLHVDHIKNRRQHPGLALDQSNLQVLCSQCNWGKSNRHDTDWRHDGDPLTSAYKATLAED